MQGKITNYNPDTGEGLLEVERQAFDAIDVITKEMLKKNEATKVRMPPTIGEGGVFFIGSSLRKKRADQI